MSDSEYGLCECIYSCEDGWIAFGSENCWSSYTANDCTGKSSSYLVNNCTVNDLCGGTCCERVCCKKQCCGVNELCCGSTCCNKDFICDFQNSTFKDPNRVCGDSFCMSDEMCFQEKCCKKTKKCGNTCCKKDMMCKILTFNKSIDYICVKSQCQSKSCHPALVHDLQIIDKYRIIDKPIKPFRIDWFLVISLLWSNLRFKLKEAKIIISVVIVLFELVLHQSYHVLPMNLKCKGFLLVGIDVYDNSIASPGFCLGYDYNYIFIHPYYPMIIMILDILHIIYNLQNQNSKVKRVKKQ
jgi:hypothetical protein